MVVFDTNGEQPLSAMISMITKVGPSARPAAPPEGREPRGASRFDSDVNDQIKKKRYVHFHV